MQSSEKTIVANAEEARPLVSPEFGVGDCDGACDGGCDGCCSGTSGGGTCDSGGFKIEGE